MRLTLQFNRFNESNKHFEYWSVTEKSTSMYNVSTFGTGKHIMILLQEKKEYSTTHLYRIAWLHNILQIVYRFFIIYSDLVTDIPAFISWVTWSDGPYQGIKTYSKAEIWFFVWKCYPSMDNFAIRISVYRVLLRKSPSSTAHLKQWIPSLPVTQQLQKILISRDVTMHSAYSY